MKNKYVDIIYFLMDNLIEENNYRIKSNKLKEKLFIEIYVSKINIGKVIGKNGKVITSMRNLINSISNKEKLSIEIKVIEEN